MRSSLLAPRATTHYNIQDHSERDWLPAYALTIQIIVTFLVWIRIISRFSTTGRPGFDDVLIFLAWISGTLMTAVCILSVNRYGFNKHIWDIPVEDWWKGGLVAFIIESLFLWSTCLTKVSVLMFYRRLVQGTYSRKFKLALWAAIAFVIAYTVAFFVLTFTACRPFVALWQQYNPDWLAKNPNFVCADPLLKTQLSELAGALSVITDFYSVMLPAVLVFNIRITKRQKYGLCFIFGMGYLVVAAGTARTIYLGRAEAEVYDKSWAAFNIFIASIAECDIAIACACAPSLKTVFGRFFRDMSTKYGSGGNSKISSETDSKNNNDSYDDIHIGYRENSDAISKIAGPVKLLKAKTSRLKTKLGGNKKEIVVVYIKEDGDGFKGTHEHRIACLTPVASGRGGGLVSPIDREFSRIIHQQHNKSRLAESTETSKRTSLTARNVRCVPGPLSHVGSYIISPSPSVSSDDETSPVDNKKTYGRDGDFSYSLPEREQSRPVFRAPPTLIQPPALHFTYPLSDLDRAPRMTSSLSENSFCEKIVLRPVAADAWVPGGDGEAGFVRREGGWGDGG